MSLSLIYSAKEIKPQFPKDKNICLEYWRPSLCDMAPPARPYKYRVFYLFKSLRIFKNDGYGAVIAYVDNQMVGSLLVVPKYFLWPFMGDGDVQIIYVKTNPEFQGRNIASSMIYKAYHESIYLKGRIWYVTNLENEVSQRLANKVGFKFEGEGIRSKFRLSLKKGLCQLLIVILISVC